MGLTTPTLEKRDEKVAGSTALELLRQLITLASGVLALSSTFIDKLWSPTLALQILLAVAWIILALSIVAGLQAMSALVQGALQPDFSWTQTSARNWAVTSKWAFIIGIAAFALYAFLAASDANKTESRNPVNCVNVIECR
jgi:hypothetical protein